MMKVFWTFLLCSPAVGLLSSPPRRAARTRRSADAVDAVALEACEFWSSICDTRLAQESLMPVMPQLIPVLLKGMVYTEEDLLLL